MSKSWAAVFSVCATIAFLPLSGCARPASAGPRAETQVANEIRARLAGGGDTAAGGPAEAVPTGTGWGGLKGTFKFVGTPPTPGKLKVDKDQEVCGKGDGLTDNSLLVASDGGIANIVLFARVKRVHESAAPLAAENEAPPMVFDQKDCMFLTHVALAQVNQKVDIRNSDPVGHNTKIDPFKGVAFNQNLPVGQSLVYVPTQEEVAPVPVSCSIHPWMKAYMLPRNDKYFAVTGPDGSFEIANLPAGEEVEIQVWHERAAGANGALVLPNTELKWTSKGRFKIMLDADQTKDLVLEVPASAFQ